MKWLYYFVSLVFICILTTGAALLGHPKLATTLIFLALIISFIIIARSCFDEYKKREADLAKAKEEIRRLKEDIQYSATDDYFKNK